MKVSDPRTFGRVAVVMGGNSAEREVSLNSGAGVLRALCQRGVDAHPVDGIPALLDALRAGHFARVFNVLHGRGGEDGVLQGALCALGVPYTGSGVLGSALGMDKIRCKQVWQTLKLPTPRYATVDARHPADIDAILKAVGLPLIVKPVHEGSTVGITRVHQAEALAAGIAAARVHDRDILIEQLIVGDEYTVGILGRQALPSIRIVPAQGFYDYQAKYRANDTQYLCPGLTGAAETEIQALALAAFDAIGGSGWGRVDVMRDADAGLWLLEVNTAPGMTDHSLVPKAAAEIGIDYPELCWRILEQSLDEVQP
ncbi:MAG: D-alanine--D-alanine ligase [Lysobacterales bacterium CG02_land_8_20_14_3_00_62_12]|nr:MAG: D-alanine--D-alanine ligase [Xanthomonadales bacterium CG02_land_8_20_14_3_00_62_12]PJA37590.1 MAG: D-alanine--D-alanine ligase [Xanthomonadales bacterium CG_4_9_14_3_um_filter_62_6]